jgi:hypothetical protein
MADVAALVVALSAQLTQFEKDMQKAGAIADQSVRNIEQKFKSANINFPGIDELGSKLKSLATVAGIGLLINQIDDLVQEVAKLGEAAERVGLTSTDFQKLQYALIASGASAQDAAGFLDQFSRHVAEAATGTGKLYDFLRVNNIVASEFVKLPLNQQLARYADLVKNTGNAQERLNEAFMVAGRELGPAVVGALSQGAEGLRKAGEEAKKTGAILDPDLVEKARKLAIEWAKLKQTLTVSSEELAVSTWVLLKNSISSVTGAIGDFLAKLQEAKGISDAAKTAAAGPPEEAGTIVPGVGFVPTRTPGAGPPPLPPPFPRRRGVEILSPISMFGAPVQDERFRPAPVEAGDDSTKRINAQAEALKKLLETEQKHAAVLEAETKTIGQSVYQQTLQKTQIELESQAREKNIPLTAQSTEKIREQAAATAKAAEELYKAQQAWAGLNTAVQFAGQQLVDVLDSIIFKTSSLTDAAKSLEKALINALLQASLVGGGPLAGVLGLGATTPGGTGGILGALFTRRQSGGSVSPGQPYIVGEHGAELFMPRTGGQIIPGQIAAPSSSGDLKVYVQNFTSGDTETRQMQRQGPDGRELVIQVIKSEMASGGFDGVNRARYGLRAQKSR